MVAHRRTAGEIRAASPGADLAMSPARTGDRLASAPWQPSGSLRTTWTACRRSRSSSRGLPSGRRCSAGPAGWSPAWGPRVVRLTATQVAFRHRIGFAWLWLPGAWLAHPEAEVVLSLALRQRLDSPRWKQVVEPYPGRWMHHLEVRDLAALDDELAGWVAAAYAAAA